MKPFSPSAGALALLAMSMARAALGAETPTSQKPERVLENDLSFVPVESQVPTLLTHEMDACHKRDTRPKTGPNYPCVAQAWIEHTCRVNGTTPEHLAAQRDCMCGEGSSFFQDAVACSSCKTGYALQGVAEHQFWQSFYGKLQDSYCGAKELEGNFVAYYEKAEPQKNYPPPMGQPPNIVENKFGPIGVVQVKTYYPNAPETQGPGKFTPVPPKSENDATPASSGVTVDGLLNAPALVLVRPNKTVVPSSGTSIPPSPVVDVGSRPTTLLPIKASNSTTPTSLASSVAEAKPTSSGELVVNGEAEAFTVYTAMQCIVAFGASMNDFKFVCKSVQVQPGSVHRLATKEQWEAAMELPDAGNIKNCETVLQYRGISGTIVSKDNMVPQDKNASKLPTKPLPPSDDKTVASNDHIPSPNKTGSKQDEAGPSGSPAQKADAPHKNCRSKHVKAPNHSGSSTAPVTGSSNTRVGGQSGNETPGNQTPSDVWANSCASKASIQQKCVDKRECMCSQPFFERAVACANQDNISCQEAKSQTQFYLELKEKFCVNNELGEDFSVAYNKLRPLN